MYRGVSGGHEIDLHKETEYILSDAARIAYEENGHDLEKALKTSQEVHKKWIKIWGDEETYAQAHSEFGLELNKAFGLERTLISFTTDKEVADRFKKDGIVVDAMVHKSQLIPQTLPGSGESEQLIRHGIKIERKWE